MAKLDRHGRPPPAAILRLIVDHQRWINSGGRFGKRLDRDELPFVNCDLDGVDLSGANLRHAYFDGGSARMARFIGTNLYNSKFDGCDVEGANFSRADLLEATFVTNHDKACFDGANIEHTAWSAEEERANLKAYRTQRLARLKDLSTMLKGP